MTERRQRTFWISNRLVGVAALVYMIDLIESVTA